MIKYEHLVGLPYKVGEQDCYGLARRFFAENFDLNLTNYARPENFWEHGLNLYMENYQKEGFEVIDVRPDQIRPADVFLIAVRSSIPNHCAIHVGEGRILHHFYNRFSELELYKGIWRRQTTAILRHRDIRLEDVAEETIDVLSLVPTHKKAKYDAARAVVET